MNNPEQKFDKIQYRRPAALEMKKRYFKKRFHNSHISQISWSNKNMELMFKWAKNPKNILVLIGPPGTGKTHACSALFELLYDKFPHGRYFEEYDMMQRLKQTFQHNGYTEKKELELMLDDHFTILNDLGAARMGSEDRGWREDMWFTAIDILYTEEKIAVISSNLTRKDLDKTCHKRLASRLFSKENTIIDLSGEKDWRGSGE